MNAGIFFTELKKVTKEYLKKSLQASAKKKWSFCRNRTTFYDCLYMRLFIILFKKQVLFRK